MLLPITILQIGAGGTGSWFARALMHNLAEIGLRQPDNARRITWIISDPDTVENRNLIRQPFYGGIKNNKAEYVSKLVRHTLDFLKVPGITVRGKDSLVLDLSDFGSEFRAVTFIVCCVDNTLSRSKYEDYLIANAVNNDQIMIWVNMGVSAEGDWSVELLDTKKMLKTPYETITYPDSMIGCADREEQSPVPQSTFSNIMAGSVAAQAVTECLAMPIGELSNYMKIVYGDPDSSAQVMPEEVYYQERVDFNKMGMEVIDNGSREEIPGEVKDESSELNGTPQGPVVGEGSGSCDDPGSEHVGAVEDTGE